MKALDIEPAAASPIADACNEKLLLVGVPPPELIANVLRLSAYAGDNVKEKDTENTTTSFKRDVLFIVSLL